ncbi:hypothetical protein D1007_02012 [Hordeum vulgare]|nr:hypothetical protein D1007_02012 [Hordeum vulgare]
MGTATHTAVEIALYHEIEKKPFTFSHYWIILNGKPKWTQVLNDLKADKKGNDGSRSHQSIGLNDEEYEMDKIVSIHYVDKEAFMNVDIVDKYEEVLIFFESPTYEEVVEETRVRLKWVDPSDQVELLGRYDVWSARKCRMKTMPIKSNLHWVAYKKVVASSVVKSLEVFASVVVKASLFHVDSNQTLVDNLSPISIMPPIVEHKVEVEANEYPQYEF